MGKKLKSALDYLTLVTEIISVVAEAGKKVMSLCED
jgi:hypothetical protein